MATIEVVKGGIESAVQDFPGRLGYWSIGIPPSGPMDSFAFRLANRLVGNEVGEAALEVAAGMAAFKFLKDTCLAITGADMQPTVNSSSVPMWENVLVKSKDVLELRTLRGSGFRTYIALAGGIDVPVYLGSRSTFAAGGFGGFNGRALKAGDVLETFNPSTPISQLTGRTLKSPIPAYTSELQIEVMEGPHSAPDFFTEDDMKSFFSEPFKVDLNSNRLGYRLAARKWTWARPDGGIAGKHPSNILDNGYSVGAVNVSGDQPIILTVDGPSLGGFVCCACVISASLWKIGQARPGRDNLRFKKVSMDEATDKRKSLERSLIEAVD
ncbi:MAG: 5-oxoprolinase/urea amidolyase family protein [Candidatus Bathyarchaeia archaeon]